MTREAPEGAALRVMWIELDPCSNRHHVRAEGAARPLCDRDIPAARRRRDGGNTVTCPRCRRRLRGRRA